ncbi:MAG: NusA-like transcription termination signal-binding factor [Thermoprotei archaeon]|nr:MAG: NusA-like transcription termination signal-binding factor [Thermoprotei archaeon]RLE89232.1 MAG: NusA-like transcription termination signal-binding factor [Thermoprotei archaeon]
MNGIRLTEREMQCIALFESFTGVTVKDCILDDRLNRIIFVVKEGQAGLAIGKRGINVKRLKGLLRKDLEIVEYASTPEELARKCLFPARVLSVRISTLANNKKVAIIQVPPSDKGLAVGKGGRNVSRLRLLMKRYFDIDKVTLI